MVCVCVCVSEAPLPLLYRGLAWSVGGIFPESTPALIAPFMSELPQQSGTRRQREGLGSLEESGPIYE
jgi:hypothetical protein